MKFSLIQVTHRGDPVRAAAAPRLATAAPQAALPWDPLHFPSPGFQVHPCVVAEEAATPLSHTAQTPQGGCSVLQLTAASCKPRSRRGGSLSNPTADHVHQFLDCWSCSLLHSTAVSGTLAREVHPLSQHVPPLWVCTAMTCHLHQRLITTLVPSLPDELTGFLFPRSVQTDGASPRLGSFDLAPYFSPADALMLSVLPSALHAQGRRPAELLPRQAMITCPSGPAPGSRGCRPPPSLLSDLRDAISAQIPLRPAWMAGQQYHPPLDYACVSTPPPAQSSRRYYTLFEPRLDHRQRSAPRDWRLIDFVTDAVREVQERVRLVYLVTRPMPGFAAPQLVLTLARAPAGCRSVPLDLRGIGGLVHTVEVLFPSPATSVWGVLHDKGLDATGEWEAAHEAGHLYLLDQDGREIAAWEDTADGPEWAEFATRPGPWRHRRISYGSTTATAVASTTPTTTAVAVERQSTDHPPSLLGACLLRPSCPQGQGSAALPFRVYPEQFSSAQVRGLPAAQLCLYSGVGPGAQGHDGIHQAQEDWTVEQYLQEAAARSHTAARMVRFLSLPVPGLPDTTAHRHGCYCWGQSGLASPRCA